MTYYWCILCCTIKCENILSSGSTKAWFQTFNQKRINKTISRSCSTLFQSSDHAAQNILRGNLPSYTHMNSQTPINLKVGLLMLCYLMHSFPTFLKTVLIHLHKHTVWLWKWKRYLKSCWVAAPCMKIHYIKSLLIVILWILDSLKV